MKSKSFGIKEIEGEQGLEPSKILGIIWNDETDNFIFDFAEIGRFS